MKTRFFPYNFVSLRWIIEFPDEDSCKSKWKEYRDNLGVVCIRCGCEEHYWKSDKECYECKKCRYRQSLRSNTDMHGGQLPLKYWFVAMHLHTSTKKSFSALELRRQFGHRNYNPIWPMLHKLRMAMGKQDGKYMSVKSLNFLQNETWKNCIYRLTTSGC